MKPRRADATVTGSRWSTHDPTLYTDPLHVEGNLMEEAGFNVGDRVTVVETARFDAMERALATIRALPHAPCEQIRGDALCPACIANAADLGDKEPTP